MVMNTQNRLAHLILLVITFICLESRRLFWVQQSVRAQIFHVSFRSGIDLSAFHTTRHYNCGRVHMKTGYTIGVWNYSTRHGQFGHVMKFVVDGTGDSMGFFLASFFFCFFFFSTTYTHLFNRCHCILDMYRVRVSV